MRRQGAKIGGIVLLAVVLVLSCVITGCKGKNTQTAQAGNAARTGDLEDLAVLKVPAGAWAYVAQEKGWFKETFEDKGIKVELVEGVLGNEAQLMARDDVHFAGRMIYPFLLYRASGADLTTIQVSGHPSPDVASIVVLEDSPYKIFADLRGQKIGTWRAGCPFMVLVQMTDDEGWVEGVDWFHANIRDGDYKTALLTGAVAAISCHPGNDIQVMIANGTARQIAYPREDSPYVQGGGVTVVFTPTQFAQKYPKIVQKYLDLQQSANTWILNNQDEAGAIVEKITRTPVEMSKISWERSRGNMTYSEKDLALIRRETQVTVDWLESHREVEKGKLLINELFAPQFFNN
jgi:ABC-type nitrate/sulfonate/bicarbonate transport system substrate-binding protein